MTVITEDLEFTSKTRQIIAYWRQMTGPAGVAEPAVGSVSAGSQLGREGVAMACPAGGQAVVTPPYRGPWDKFLYWFNRLLLTVFIPGLGVVALFFAVPAIGPAWSAHLRHGVPGIFTATTVSRFQTCMQTCHPDVNWYGTFTARTGSVITGVRLAEGGHIAGLGDQQAALYEGGGVAYPAGGGPDWLALTLLLIIGIAAITYWIVLLVRMLIRRRRRLAGAPASSLSYSRP